MAIVFSPNLSGSPLVPASKTLTTRAAELNAATKRLSAIAEQIECGLQKLNLGISCFVPVSSCEDGSSESLGYTKFKGRWALVVREFKLDGGGEFQAFEDCLLIDAPRDVRIRAIGEITALFNELSSEAETLTKKLTKNLGAAEAIAKLINGEAVVAPAIAPGVKK